MNIGTAMSSSFPANSITVLDKSGNVIASNRARSRFEYYDEIESIAESSDNDDYIDVRRRAAERKSEEGRKAHDGIKSVIDGLRYSFEMDYERNTPTGQRYFRMSVTQRLDGGGGAIVSHHDITEKKMIEERMFELSGQLIKAQENERSRIARELHDDLNQRLALLSFEMDQLGQEMPSSPDEFRRRMRELWNSIRFISTDINRIAYQLHPSKLDTLGLVPALRGLCNEVSTHHPVQVEFINRDIPESLSKDIALCIFRIVQEALSNVIKHSGAREARVKLIGSYQAIRLSIADPGTGFEIDLVRKRGGLGLISMQERLRLVGGEISIKSRPLYGTEINVQIPLTTY